MLNVSDDLQQIQQREVACTLQSAQSRFTASVHWCRWLVERTGFQPAHLETLAAHTHRYSQTEYHATIRSNYCIWDTNAGGARNESDDLAMIEQHTPPPPESPSWLCKHQIKEMSLRGKNTPQAVELLEYLHRTDRNATLGNFQLSRWPFTLFV